MITIQSILKQATHRQQRLASGAIIPDATRCVQCGICSFNCPLGIDVRRHALQGLPVIDSACLTCGECVQRCPRGVLRFERAPVMAVSIED
jgi:ferredoxin